MKRILVLGVVFMVGLWVFPGYGRGCTLFLINKGDHVLVAKNHDFMAPDGYLIANKRGQEKSALVYLGGKPGNPARWTSKYGSVTQNQYGRELPYGGINEAGLVVEMLMMPGTQYPAAQGKPGISQLQWVQYQLDNYAGVKAVLSNLDKLRIVPTPKAPGLHYFIADAGGDSAVIEFIDGGPVQYLGASLPHKILTNSPYAGCLDSLKSGKFPEKDEWQSDVRFVQAAKSLDKLESDKPGDRVMFAFDTLSQIKWQAPTRWTLVYDLGPQRIFYRPAKAGATRFVDLADFDFSCATPVQAVNINSEIKGSGSPKIIKYTPDLNKALISSTLNAFALGPEISEKVLSHRTNYLESLGCAD